MHPLSSANPSPGRWAEGLAGCSRCPTTQRHFPALPEPEEIYNLSSFFWVYPGSLTIGHAQKTLSKGRPGSDARTTSDGPFWHKGAVALP